MLDYQVYLPGRNDPVSVAEYAEFVAQGNHDGKGSLNPDIFVYDDRHGQCVTVKKDPVA
jgi:hypothetical protein